MKTLIVYSTKYGTTEKCANILAQKIGDDVTLKNIGTDKKADVSGFDCVIIGGPMYMGQLKSDVKKFCSKNAAALVDKKVGLFICHMDKDNDILDIITAQFPDALIQQAVVKRGFGGACKISEMRGMDKFIFTKMAKQTKDTEDIDNGAIEEFADRILA